MISKPKSQWGIDLGGWQKKINLKFTIIFSILNYISYFIEVNDWTRWEHRESQTLKNLVFERVGWGGVQKSMPHWLLGFYIIPNSKYLFMK